MNLLYAPVTYGIKGITRILCKIDDAELAKIPKKGPLMLLANHVNFADVPIAYTHLVPRPISALAKIESWDSLGLRFLLNVWGSAIPIRRGEVDREAIESARQALEAGRILAIAVEGTRSLHGKLQKGRPGVLLLARLGVPMQPLVYYGHEDFWHNLPRFKRTPFHFVVGNPFRLDLKGAALSRDVREKATDEIMFQLAAILPEQYRGVYSDLSQATEEFLQFEPGVESNLKRAMVPK
jgi:1-acyl-sn-glycerol-3-phosphate acyltransferase